MADPQYPVVPPPIVTIHPGAPTTAQVVSAAVQNVFIAGCVTTAWMYGKIDATIALPALGSVLGIDFVHFLTRKAIANSGRAAAAVVGIGATGVLNGLTKTLHL